MLPLRRRMYSPEKGLDLTSTWTLTLCACLFEITQGSKTSSLSNLNCVHTCASVLGWCGKYSNPLSFHVNFHIYAVERQTTTGCSERPRLQSWSSCVRRPVFVNRAYLWPGSKHFRETPRDTGCSSGSFAPFYLFREEENGSSSLISSLSDKRPGLLPAKLIPGTERKHQWSSCLVGYISCERTWIRYKITQETHLHVRHSGAHLKNLCNVRYVWTCDGSFYPKGTKFFSWCMFCQDL